MEDVEATQFEDENALLAGFKTSQFEEEPEQLDGGETTELEDNEATELLKP